MFKLKCDTNLKQKGLTQTACCYIYYWRHNKGGHLKRGALQYINCLSPKSLNYLAQPRTSCRLGLAFFTSSGNGKYSFFPTTKSLQKISVGSVKSL